MDAKAVTALSKFLSFVLRHEPATAGIDLDANGWVEVERLLAACAAHGRPLSREVLDTIVATSPKQRFALSEDGTRIRASQGHSVAVDLGYAPAIPPDVLYHGTVAASLPAIRERGLEKMARHDVHLSTGAAAARAVGTRRGAPVILTVASGRMHHDGYVFQCSANGVWLTAHVPPEYIAFPGAP